jgi:hypothetical protein
MHKLIYLRSLSVVIYSTANSSENYSSSTFLTRLEVRESVFSPGTISTDGATKIIELILETVGLQVCFEVKKVNVPNAAAIVYQGKRYILYNPSFIAAMDKAAGTPWASVAVLAHEIGHHLNGHTLDGKGSPPAIELEADEFSGFALRKNGCKPV